MRVLLVNQYFPPDTSATAGLADLATRALTEAGHEVTVVAGWPSYRPAETWRWRPFARRPHGTVRTVRVGSTALERERMAGRVANYLSFGALALPAAAAQRFDVVLAMTDPPFAGTVGLAAARLRGRPFLYWLQDYLPDFLTATGLLPESAITRGWRWIHERTIRHADRVVVLGDDMAGRVQRAGARPGRVTIVHNGTAVDRDPDPAARAEPRAVAIRGSADFVVMHAGEVGMRGAFDTLIAAAGAFDPGTDLVFMGEGTERVRLETAATSLPQVRFVDRVPQDEVHLALAAADVQVVTVRAGAEGLTVPSKIYEMFRLGFPVLVVADESAEAARLVTHHDCGIVAHPDDPEAVAKAVRWCRDHPDELRAMGERAAAAGLRYRRADMMRRLAVIVAETAAKGRRA